MGAVTVGERGQVVIPAQARESMAVEPGDKLLAFVHPTGQMVCLCKIAMLEQLAESLSRLPWGERAKADDDDGEQ